jgi:hypothetical protein
MRSRYGPGWASMMAFGVLLATFVAGGLAGGAVVRMLSAGEAPPLEETRPTRTPVFAGEGPLSDRLDLTAQQRQQIEQILIENRQMAAQLLREMQPRLRARYDSTIVAIDAVLTPDQRVEFRRMRSEERDRIRRGGFGPGWPTGRRDQSPPAAEDEGSP